MRERKEKERKKKNKKKRGEISTVKTRTVYDKSLF
jgi:hypothetical protein